MSFHPSHIRPDVALKEYLQELLQDVKFEYADDTKRSIAIYSDWERPTNTLPQDFITIYVNGDVGGVGMDTPYASGYLAVSLYCKMDDDGAVNTVRIERILKHLDKLIDFDTVYRYIREDYEKRDVEGYEPHFTDEQRERLIKYLNESKYYFRYDASRFITPTTPNQSSGYSITTLNLRWTTTSNINS